MNEPKNGANEQPNKQTTAHNTKATAKLYGGKHTQKSDYLLCTLYVLRSRIKQRRSIKLIAIMFNINNNYMYIYLVFFFF